jgi:hypothetical protein
VIGVIDVGIRVTIAFDPTTTALLEEQHTVADPSQLATPTHDPATSESIRQRETLAMVLATETFSTPIVVNGDTATKG